MGSSGLSVTSYALLGLLIFDGRTDNGMTGYELKRLADSTLRFYWVSPAMSQVYSELAKLTRAGLVKPYEAGPRRATKYRITDEGERLLRTWLSEQPAGFPVLRHPVALRLLMGHLSSPEELSVMLKEHLAALSERRADLQAIRDNLGDNEAVRYPAMVADWGLAYYDGEAGIVASLLDRLRITTS